MNSYSCRQGKQKFTVVEIKWQSNFQLVLTQHLTMHTLIDSLYFCGTYTTKRQASRIFRELIWAENMKAAVTDLIIKTLGWYFQSRRTELRQCVRHVGDTSRTLWARIRHLNSLAPCTSCAAHSLNLVGFWTSDSCLTAASYLACQQALHNF